MGAGPTPKQVTDGRRRVFQRIAREYGGEYVPVTKGSENYAHGDGWTIKARLLRASNGEAALLFSSTANGKSAEAISYAEALDRVGVKAPA